MMKKIFNKKNIIIGLSVAAIIATIILINKKEEKPFIITTVSPSLLKNVVKENNELFIISGESSSVETKLLLESIMDIKKEISHPIFFLDTLYFTDSLNDKDTTKEKKDELLNRFAEYRNKHKITTLPTITYIKDGESIESTEDFLGLDYFSEVDENKKQIILNNANLKLTSWFQNKK